MKVAAIQHDIDWEEPELTRKRVGPMIGQAAAAGARLVALTEMYATGFSMRTERIAEEEGGPNEQFLVDSAREHGCWVLASVAQTGQDGRARNNAVLAAPDGSVERYAKIHPFSYAREHEYYAAGDRFLTVDIEGVRTTVFVCYDLRFGDEFWALARETDLYVVVANWPEPRREHWRTLLRARAIENQSYVLGVNRVGTVRGARREHRYAGDTALIDPLGMAVVEAAGQEAVLIADVDPARVADIRRELPFLPDRRTG